MEVLDRRSFLRNSIYASLILAVGAGCKRSVDSNAVKIGITPFQDTVIPVIPQALGWYEQAGLDARMVDMGWEDVPLAITRGEADVALYNFDSFLANSGNLAQREDPMVFHSPLYVFNGAAIMVREIPDGVEPVVDISSLSAAEVQQKVALAMSSLRGKRIGITESTTFEQVVLDAIDKAGLSREDFSLIHASASDNLAAFLAGGLDAFSGGLTERVQANQRGAKQLIAGPAVSLPVIDGFICRKSFADRNGPILQELINQFFRTVRYMNEDLIARAPLATEYLRGKASVDYTPEQFSVAWSFQYFPKNREEAVNAFLSIDSPYFWERIWDENNKFLVNTGKLEGPIPKSLFLGADTLRG